MNLPIGPLGRLNKIDIQTTRNSAYNIGDTIQAVPSITFTNTRK